MHRDAHRTQKGKNSCSEGVVSNGLFVTDKLVVFVVVCVVRFVFFHFLLCCGFAFGFSVLFFMLFIVCSCVVVLCSVPGPGAHSGPKSNP